MNVKMSDPKNQYLTCKDGTQLAYRRLPGKTPGVVFLGGFMSDMTGTKATYLWSLCEKMGRSYLCFDYFGHGASSGSMEEGTIGRWKQDAILVLDTLTEGKQILVGSSMGGWLMVLTALERQNRIKALVGIAAAPDFVESLTLLNEKQHKTLEKEGICYVPSQLDKPYPITKNLILEGRNHTVLERSIPVTCPVRLLHGLKDESIPWQDSVKLAECLESQDVRVTLIKEGDHRLMSESNLAVLADTVCQIFEL